MIETCRTAGKLLVYPCVIYLLNKYGLDPEGLIFYVLLVWMDMIGGVGKSWVLYSKNDIHWFSWSRFFKGFFTKLYNLALFCISIASITYLFKEGAPIVEFAGMTFLIVGQLIGVLHNGQQMHLKKEIPERDFTAKMYEYLINFLSGVLERIPKK